MMRRFAKASVPRGFTLVEMIIVIGIIAILATLTIPVITAATRSSETRQIRDAMTLLETAFQEWERTNDRPISYGTDGQPPDANFPPKYDVQAQTDPTNSTQIDAINVRTLEVLGRVAAAKGILNKISAKLLRQQKTAEAKPEIIDPWDRQLIFVYAGRLWMKSSDGGRDEDGTIRTPFEARFGVCKNRRPYVMSAGPDGRYGNLSASKTSSDYSDTQDNEYSYEPTKP